MKVGIITFHKANNLGAVLQTFALFKYIKNSGVECEIIDFIPNNQVTNDFLCIRRILRTAKKFFCYLKNGFKIKVNKIDDFRKKHLMISSATYFGDKNIFKNPPDKYDIIISGSDQILNTTLTGNSKSYYLAFPTDALKVSYASSFGRSKITDDEKALIQQELPKFKYLSCREQDGIHIINKESGLSPTLVTDPTFLLNAEQWDRLCCKPLLPEKYIFVYAMEYSFHMDKAIHEIKKLYNLPVYILCGSQSAQQLSGNKVYNYGPAEFLSAIKNAELVITNSFHGTAFSIIFGKQFFCVSHSTRNSRLENIMTLSGTSDKLIDTSYTYENIEQFLLNGNQCYLNLKPLIEKSKTFLSNIFDKR